jgi:pimeloyl-ACP methyl ester carboxylesterase/DNA-binding CsgD family transcriptional regulator
MSQRVRYVSTAEGVNLAWASIGQGLPLVRAATWLTHLQYDPESPVWAHWIRFLGDHFRCIRYDERGCGMSDRDVPAVGLPQWVDDLERVVDAAGLDRPFALLGISQGAATSIVYAVRHPERVSHLVLYGGYALGGNKREGPDARAMFRAVMQITRLGWGRDDPAFRQLFTSRFLPEGTPEQLEWFNALCQRTTSAETASKLLEARGNVDVRDYLSQVRVPTLVLHSTRDQIAPLSQGRLLASAIPGAAFVPLDSPNHVLLAHEPAWQHFQEAVLAFTGQGEAVAALRALSSLTERERRALDWLCAGLSNAQIAWELGIAEKTVRNHLSHLYRKLGVRSRAEAIVHARQGVRDTVE